MKFDEAKAQEMSQSISAILDHTKATMGEGCAAITLSLRCWLDLEPDTMLRAYLLMHIFKNLTKDVPKVEIIHPNGN
jgi:hypothetical protein